jgi:hypothetical protein
MSLLKRVCFVAPILLGAAIEPAAAQYNVISSGGVTYTNVVVNGEPQTLDDVLAFKLTCNIRAVSGSWWLENGLLGRVGGPAVYNVNTSQAVTNNSKPEGECHYYSSGTICPGSGGGLSVTVYD